MQNNNIHLLTCTLPDAAQKAAILQLWNEEYPVRLRHHSLQSLESYLEKLHHPQHIFLLQDEKISGWCFSFEREGERWFAIIVDKAAQGLGYGRMLLQHLKEHNTTLNGWVIDREGELRHDGQPYPSPLAFYLKQGFKTEAGMRLETEHISAVKIVWKAAI